MPNRPRTVRTLIAGSALLGAAVTLAACSNDVTPSRLQSSLAPSFDNLYAKQAALLGHPSLTPADVAARATCKKGLTGTAQTGPGANWLCVLTWHGVGGTPMKGKFEVNAKASSCYVAGGPTLIVGPATLTDTHGNTVTNPVSEWDVCFDPGN